MSLKRPDTRPKAVSPNPITAEIADINHEFLRLLTHPAVRGADQLLGLDPGVLAALACLDAREIERVASAPLLLAEFRPFPGFGGIREDRNNIREYPPLGAAWLQELNDFANRLLTCMWQTARRDPLRASLFMGVTRQDSGRLAEFGFSNISRCSAQAAGSLQVRLAGHPRFWADLVSLVRTGNDTQQVASRLALIQLSIADRSPGWSRQRRHAYA